MWPRSRSCGVACLQPLANPLTTHSSPAQLWYFVHQHKVVQKAAAEKAAAWTEAQAGRALLPRQEGDEDSATRQDKRRKTEPQPHAGATDAADAGMESVEAVPEEAAVGGKGVNPEAVT